jgi:hypothetical protein
MQTLTEAIFKLDPPGGLFDLTVVANLYPELSAGARKLLLHRAVKRQELLRLKPGAFVLAPQYRRTHPHPFVVAAVLHAPSHVSLQTALAYHGLIPEAVFQVSSVTVARTRSFTTPLGVFSFQRVPSTEPRAGVEALEVARGSWAFVATPLRAIADMVYLDARLRWETDGLAWLSESLRIEPDDCAGLSFERYDEIHDAFRDGRTRDYLAGLKEALDAHRTGA